MKDFLLSYETVYLRPKLSTLESRSFADTSMYIGGRKFRLPVMPANMVDVIGVENAKWLSENDYFYIYHRFSKNDFDTIKFLEKTNEENWKLISISIGVNEKAIKEIEHFKDKNFRIDFITIDVAHAHHERLKKIIPIIKSNFPETHLIVGNIATAEASEFLYDLGIRSMKVGIGSGSICTTRHRTGFHLPTLHSVYEVYNALKNKSEKVFIIADGGAKQYGDIAKALTFGASALMSGNLFASCIDSPAKIVEGKKVYRGSTSFEIKGEIKNVEGKALFLDGGITYEQRIEEISQALKSSISYAGGKDLSAFKDVEWGRVLEI